MELTKHNTALDLSKLTEGEADFLGVPKYIFEASKNGLKHYAHLYDREKPELGIAWCGDLLVDRDRLAIVDFHTFKSIHFPEQDDKPTYEELVEALEACMILCKWHNLDVKMAEIINKLLERIKS